METKFAAICPDKSRVKESSAGSAVIYISAKSSEIIKKILIILCVFLFIIQYSLNRRYYIIFLFLGEEYFRLRAGDIVFQEKYDTDTAAKLLFFIRILPVKAEIGLAPRHHSLQDGNETFAKFCQGIFHLRRDFLINLPVKEAVAFQFPELFGEGGLCDAVKAAQQFAEPLYLIKGHIP